MNNISKIKEKSGHHEGGYDNNRKIKVGYHFLYVKFFIEVRSQTWTNSCFDNVSYIGNFLSKYLEIFVGVFKSKHILHFIPDSSINSVEIMICDLLVRLIFSLNGNTILQDTLLFNLQFQPTVKRTWYGSYTRFSTNS